MEDYGIASGVKGLSNSLNSTREASKELTKTIEGIQHDAIDVAHEELEARQRHKAHEEAIENSMIYRAIKEYQNQITIIKAENKAEVDFKAKYGSKEWTKVLELKTVVEKEHKENQKYYGHKLEDVKRVQLYCWVAAAIVTYFLWRFNLV
jgi:hypothetical protein